jgi:LEA14-like dessication related protein
VAAKRFLATTLFLILAGCSLFAPKFEKPTLAVTGVELMSGNLLQQKFRVKFNIQNPNDRALPVTGLQATLNVSGEQVATGANDHAFIVPAKGDVDFDMVVTSNLAMALLKLANSRDQHAELIAYELTGSASIDLPFMHNLPFHQTGSFALKGILGGS